MIEVYFLNDWRLELYFYREPTTFLFNHVVLYYKLTGDLFPNSIHNGAQSEIYDSTFINSTLFKSYRCFAGIEVDLSEVKIYLRNLTLEPFFNKRPNLPFDPAEVCPQDNQSPVNDSNRNLIVLIVIATILALLVGCCTWFICYKVTSEYTAVREDRDIIKVRV